MSGMDVALRPEERAVHGLELAERVFTPERRTAIAQFLNITPEDPALVPYLATCAAWGLDPVMGQIWLIPQTVKVRDGDADVELKRYRPAVGRDGFLAVARRDQRFAGLKGATVCERDSFEVMYDGSDDEPKVLHRWASKPIAFEDGEQPHRWRGKVLGAWAKAYVKGQPPTFYFAPIHEHIRMRDLWEYDPALRRRAPVKDAAGNQVRVPDGAWGYLSTMILKCAQSYVLRIALGITGVVPADEMPPPDADGQVIEEGLLEPRWAEFDCSRFTQDAELAERLRAALVRVNEVAPLSWPVAKLEMVATGMDDQAIADLAARIEREADLLVSHAQEAAASRSEESAGDSSGAETPTGEGVTDAQVVDLTPEQQEHVDALRQRLRGLEDRLNEPGIEDDEASALAAEFEQVDGELRAAENPEQGRLI